MRRLAMHGGGGESVAVFCAWCPRAIDETPTLFHGVPFHWRCLRRRMSVLRPFACLGG